MTHATAPRSACTFAQAHPTMSCIRLVTYNIHHIGTLDGKKVVGLKPDQPNR